MQCLMHFSGIEIAGKSKRRPESGNREAEVGTTAAGRDAFGTPETLQEKPPNHHSDRGRFRQRPGIHLNGPGDEPLPTGRRNPRHDPYGARQTRGREPRAQHLCACAVHDGLLRAGVPAVRNGARETGLRLSRLGSLLQ